MNVELPEYLPLEEAARRYKVGLEILKQAIENGKIRAVRAEGRTLVASEDAMTVAVQVQASNAGDEIVSINEAGRRLGIHPATISAWVSYGWIPVITVGKRRAKLIPLSRVVALNKLRQEYGKRGRRLIPRDA